MKQFFKDCFADFTHFIPDSLYLKLIYRLKMHKRLNLRNPETFNEKLQWLKLHERKTIYSTMVDKYEAKKYMKDALGSDYSIPTIGIFDSFEQIDFNSLPDQFVIKTTHDSGTVFICKKKDEFDFKKCKKVIEKRMKKNLYWRTREWPYKAVKPRIIVEKFIELGDNNQCPEYKIFCFNGKAKLVLVCQGQAHGDGRSNDFFDADFNHLPVDSAYKRFCGVIDKPKYYFEMLQVAEKLAKNIPVLRVDFYCMQDYFLIGEMTFFHCSGLCKFSPEEYDYKFGQLIDLSAFRAEGEKE